MPAPATPQNLYVSTANAKDFLSWSLVVGATGYNVYRSLDNVTFTLLVAISGTPLATSYLDSAVTVGTQYWYRVTSTNGTESSPTLSQSVVPCTPGETSLGQIRLLAQQRADRVASNFVSTTEWNSFINLACYELYDLLITTYDDYYVAPPIQFTTIGGVANYPLPNGLLTFIDWATQTPVVAKSLYKLRGLDLGVDNANNGFVTVHKFNFEDRNKYFYPNTASTIYGVFNLSYRMLGSQLQFIPTPSANQVIRLWYFPRLTELLADTDMTDYNVSGWIQYVIIRAAKYALDKEEGDTSALTNEIMFLKSRIESSAQNRDAGQPDTIQDSRNNNFGVVGGPANGWHGGW